MYKALSRVKKPLNQHFVLFKVKLLPVDPENKANLEVPKTADSLKNT